MRTRTRRLTCFQPPPPLTLPKILPNPLSPFPVCSYPSGGVAGSPGDVGLADDERSSCSSVGDTTGVRFLIVRPKSSSSSPSESESPEEFSGRAYELVLVV